MRGHAFAMIMVGLALGFGCGDGAGSSVDSSDGGEDGTVVADAADAASGEEVDVSDTAPGEEVDASDTAPAEEVDAPDTAPGEEVDAPVGEEVDAPVGEEVDVADAGPGDEVDTEVELDVEPTQDIEDATIVPDAAAGDTTDDGGGPGRAPRVLIERRLFGTSPLDNRVVNPDFVRDEASWAQVDVSLAVSGRFRRRVVAGTPTGQALAAPSRRPDGSPVFLMGSVVLGGTPFEASIWLGRNALPSSATCAGTFPGGAAVVGTLAANGNFSFVELICNEASRADSSGLTWWRFEGQGDGMLGMSFLGAQDSVLSPFYVSGAVVTEAGAAARAPSILPRGRVRLATEAERRGALQTMARMRREELPFVDREGPPRRLPGAR